MYVPPPRIAVSHQCSSQLLAARISSCSEAVRSPASPERHPTPTSTSLWRPQRRRQWQTPAAASFASVILENLSGLRHCSSSSPSDERTQVWNELAFFTSQPSVNMLSSVFQNMIKFKWQSVGYISNTVAMFHFQ